MQVGCVGKKLVEDL